MQLHHFHLLQVVQRPKGRRKGAVQVLIAVQIDVADGRDINAHTAGRVTSTGCGWLVDEWMSVCVCGGGEPVVSTDTEHVLGNNHVTDDPSPNKHGYCAGEIA